MQHLTKKQMLQVGATLAIGGVGGIIAQYASFPAPFLTGSSLAVMLAGLSGMRLSIPSKLRNLCFVAIGLSMGSGVTPQIVETIGAWPLAFVGLMLSVIATFIAGKWLLQYFWHYDAMSATLAATPGHMSFVLGLSSDSGADVAIISIVQSIRVMVLTVCVPFIVTAMGLAPETVIHIPKTMSIVELAVLLPLSGFLGWLLYRLKVPAALLLGGMIVSSLAHVTGQVEGLLPNWLVIAAFTVMGCLIGTRFSGVSMAQLWKAAGAGLSIVAVAFAIALAMGTLFAKITGLPLEQLLIAFAPGGLEAMAAMAVIMQADTAFVAAQHISRLFLLSFLAPLVVAWDRRNSTE